MPKRENESDAEYKVRKKAKKAKKKAKKERKEAEKAVRVVAAPTTAGSDDDDNEDRAIVSDAQNDDDSTKENAINDKTAVVEFTSFSDAPFAKPIQKALQEAGFAAPSPIQARAWPVALAGKDLIAVAKTGSGKTLGFLLPIFHQILLAQKNAHSNKNNKATTAAPSCVVLSPTRELAIQIHGECVKFGTVVNLRAACLYGGTNVGAQIQQLQSSGGPHVIVATPGRLCDLLERQALDLSTKCSFCVLDESDRMLDMGFEKQLTQVMAALPPTKRQTLLFTATWPKAVRRVAAKFLREGETTELFVGESGDTVGELAANQAVTQSFVEAQDDQKDKKLYDILCGLDLMMDPAKPATTPKKASVVIFANTKRRVDFVANTFWNEGFATCAVHGDKPQRERDASLKQFMMGTSNILVATDVAARGLDIKGVTHVINFDMARDVESYVHRIGRTGRAGEVGEAITFWNPDYDKACSPALVTIAKKAGQKVPEFLKKYETIKTSKQWKVADAEKMTAELLK